VWIFVCSLSRDVERDVRDVRMGVKCVFRESEDVKWVRRRG